jgi:hypothetical protein
VWDGFDIDAIGLIAPFPIFPALVTSLISPIRETRSATAAPLSEKNFRNDSGNSSASVRGKIALASKHAQSPFLFSVQCPPRRSAAASRVLAKPSEVRNMRRAIRASAFEPAGPDVNAISLKFTEKRCFCFAARDLDGVLRRSRGISLINEIPRRDDVEVSGERRRPFEHGAMKREIWASMPPPVAKKKGLTEVSEGPFSVYAKTATNVNQNRINVIMDSSRDRFE